MLFNFTVTEPMVHELGGAKGYRFPPATTRLNLFHDSPLHGATADSPRNREKGFPNSH